MPKRIHLATDEREHAAWRLRATQEGLSLSEWVRQAARDRLEQARPSRITNVVELDGFFEARAEQEIGQEPDWSEHLDVVSTSRRQGLDAG